MKRTYLVSLAAALFLTASAFAAADATKEVTLVGTAKCAKCSLGIAKKCQNALVVKDGGKEMTYLMTPNDVSESFHDSICQEDKQVKVTGTIKETDGKKEITASKIEPVKG